MAHHEEQTSGIVHEFGMTPLTWWLAALAGSGLTLMIVAAAIGVVTGESVSLPFMLGLLMLIGGGAAWVGVVRPFENFDDIDQPLDGGHGHSHAPEADHAADTAHTDDAHAHAHH